MAKMLFRLPKAAKVVENPSPEEVKELAAKMPNAKPTQYGGFGRAATAARISTVGFIASVNGCALFLSFLACASAGV